MGVGVPERLEGELLTVVTEVTPGPGLYSDVKSDAQSVDGAVKSALRLWAERGNPVSQELDKLIERAVRKAMA